MCVCAGEGGGGGRGWLMDIVPPTFSWKCLKCLTSITLRLERGYFDLFLLPLPKTKTREINSKPNTKLNHHMLLKPCVWAITSYKHNLQIT